MKIWLLLSLCVCFVLLLFINSALATSGCCSWHSGVCGCSSGGRQICCDNTLSPTCTCAAPTATNNTTTFYTTKQCVDKYNALVAESNKQLEDYKLCASEYSQLITDNAKCDDLLTKANQDLKNSNTTNGWLWLWTIASIIWIIGLYASHKD